MQYMLASLPQSIRVIIITIRLLGLVGIIIVLVGVSTARELGVFQDQAYHDRKTIIQLSIDLSRSLSEQATIVRDTQSTLRQTLSVIEKQNHNMEAIQRTQCMLMHGATDRERRACLNREKW